MNIVLPGGDGELLSQGGEQLLGGRSSPKVVFGLDKGTDSQSVASGLHCLQYKNQGSTIPK